MYIIRATWKDDSGVRPLLINADWESPFVTVTLNQTGLGIGFSINDSFLDLTRQILRSFEIGISEILSHLPIISIAPRIFCDQTHILYIMALSCSLYTILWQTYNILFSKAVSDFGSGMVLDDRNELILQRDGSIVYILVDQLLDLNASSPDFCWRAVSHHLLTSVSPFVSLTTF